MALAGIMIVAVVYSTIPTRSGSHEELPTKTSSGVEEHGGDNNTTTSFLIGDIRSAGTCSMWLPLGDVGFLPFGEELDRTVCENNNMDDMISENLQYSETLRCYNVTHRWCFLNDLPEGFEFDNTFTYDEYASCVSRFYNHGGVLYSASGERMPEAFNSQCSDKLEWYPWNTIIPITGCGKDYRYRFCDEQGNIDWDMVNGVGPFNCREFSAIDVYQMGSEDESGMEDLCKEQTKGCADRIQQACKDGKYNANGADPQGECSTFAYLLEYNVACGHVNEKGEDLLCVP
ncbi:MAG: hypothetical protein SGBAC_006186 [Bacillariaceae sp.]